MNRAMVINFIIGIISLSGGIIGYMKANSRASLAMGLLFGIALLVTSYFCYKRSKGAVYIGLILIGTLTFFFAYRFVITKHMMPAGMMLIITGLGLLLELINLPKIIRSK